jgi:5-methylcytosine-specific restriction protein A
MRFCAQPGCPATVERGRCPAHAVTLEHGRPNWDIRKWYDTMRWRRLRLEVLREAAYACAQCGQITLALDVDHIVKHDGDPDRFWDRDNLQALCIPCHSSKTAQGS